MTVTNDFYQISSETFIKRLEIHHKFGESPVRVCSGKPFAYHRYAESTTDLGIDNRPGGQRIFQLWEAP